MNAFYLNIKEIELFIDVYFHNTICFNKIINLKNKTEYRLEHAGKQSERDNEWSKQAPRLLGTGFVFNHVERNLFNKCSGA